MKIAVTGASGHIGNCIVRELLKCGYQVRVLIHAHREDLANLDVDQVNGSVLELDTLNSLCEGVDAVIHLAAIIALDNRNARRVFEVNVNGTRNILGTAIKSGVKRFIHFSSIHAMQLPRNGEIMDEELELVTSNKEIYEYSKAEGERLVLGVSFKEMETLVLSPTAVIGPYDFRHSHLGKALLQLYTNSIPALINGGYNWVDVRDVAKATIKALDPKVPAGKYILSGTYSSLKELSGRVAQISGRNTPQRVIPVWMARLIAPIVGLYARLSKTEPFFTWHSLEIVTDSPQKISFEKARKHLDYSPRELNDTIRDTLDWYTQKKT